MGTLQPSRPRRVRISARGYASFVPPAAPGRGGPNCPLRQMAEDLSPHKATVIGWEPDEIRVRMDTGEELILPIPSSFPADVEEGDEITVALDNIGQPRAWHTHNPFAVVNVGPQ
jgi:hypothetical protein